MRREYPNPLGTRVRFNFSSPLNMSRITNKYMRVGDGDGVRQNPSPPRPIAMLTYISFYKITKTLFFLICSLSFLIFSLSNKLNNIYIYILRDKQFFFDTRDKQVLWQFKYFTIFKSKGSTRCQHGGMRLLIVLGISWYMENKSTDKIDGFEPYFPRCYSMVHIFQIAKDW